MKTGLLGMGSILMQDDAFGPFAIQTMAARYEFPEEVRVEDLGTPGLHLAPLMEDLEAVIIVDTVKLDGDVGEVHEYRRESLMTLPAGPRTSPHDPGLHETLLTLDMLGHSPQEFLLVGVIPGLVKAGTGLSGEIRAAYPRVERAVLDELERLGHRVERRQPEGVPDLWWLRSAKEGEER